MTELILLLVLFLAAGISLWVLLLWFTRSEPRYDAILMAATVVIAPSFLAWELTQSMRMLEGLSHMTYMLLVTIPATAPLALLYRPELRQRLTAIPVQLWRALAAFDGLSWFIALLITIVIAAIIFVTWVTPLRENDALEYATVARLIFERRSLAFYPAVDTSLTGGFYGPWTHPPGYPAILALCNLVQGHAEYPGLIRVPAVFGSITGSMLVWILGGRLAGGIAALILLSTPLYFVGGINGAVDPLRISTSLAAFSILGVMLVGDSRLAFKHAVAAGAAFGLAFFLHSIGFVVIVLAAALVLLFSGSTVLYSLRLGAATAAAAIAVVAPDIVTNLRNFGAVVADAPPVWQIPGIRFAEHLQLSRNLDSPLQIISNGLLRGLTEPANYGLTFWLGAAGAAAAAAGAYRLWRGTSHPLREGFTRLPQGTKWQIVWLAVVAGWMGMASLATAIGVMEFIKNARYVLTIFPALALLAGWWLSKGSMSFRVESNTVTGASPARTDWPAGA
jgi:hypothetical protein